ncbi:protein FAM177A1-like [Pecten maximus]|uniref:protein FAM177A1-like n=1 Tax=Pecten maximus TaxID=6579 RepID=UPI0014589FA9|nr:protein FAM177A1-like [Pecten maximus]
MTELGMEPSVTERTEFTNVSLDAEAPPVKKKQPKRILHFSDGILEEYSTDEEEEEKKPTEPLVNPKSLTWVPWFWYYTVLAASKTLKGADFCGEKLAWFFGITTPKYQYAIDEFYRLKEEEEKENARQDKILKKLEAQTLSSVDIGVDFKGVPSQKMPSGNILENVEKY